MSKDKDDVSEEKIGKRAKRSEATNGIYLLVTSMRGRPGRVCPPHGDRLYPPDPRHHALLPRVCCQSGAGEDTILI